MAVGYTRFKLRLQHSPNSDMTNPVLDELRTLTTGQLHRTVALIEKTFTAAEYLSITTDGPAVLIIENLSATVTLSASIVPAGGSARIFTIPTSADGGFAVFPNVDPSLCTLAGTADAAATARVYVFCPDDEKA